MEQISNRDFRQAMRLLTDFASMEGRTRREQESIRLARLLLRKWQRRTGQGNGSPGGRCVGQKAE